MRIPPRLRAAAVAATTVAGVSVGLGATTAAAAGTTHVSDNVPAFAKAANRVGSVSSSAPLTVSVYLTPRDLSGLQALIHDLYDPRSPRYHAFLTPAQFRSAYSPTSADLAAVKNFLVGKGLKVTNVPANRFYVDAQGTVAQVSNAFGVTQSTYRYAGKSVRSNAEAPSIPSSLAGKVTFVGGLDASEQMLVHPFNAAADRTPQANPGPGYSTPGPCSTYAGDHSATVSPPAKQYGSTIDWTPCGYDPHQIRVAYGLPANYSPSDKLTGKGVRIGITDAFAAPNAQADLDRYSQNHGLPKTTIEQHVVPGTYNFPENILDPQGWYGEEMLDLDAAHSIAPEATLVYGGAQNSWVPLDHKLIYFIDNGLADVISNSWGIYGEPNAPGQMRADEFAFMQAAATGISVLFSSGDDGDVGAQTGIAQGSWPSTSPYVTSVGGTSLLLKDATGTKDEYGWGTYRSILNGSTTNSGGTSVTGTSWNPWPPSFLYGAGGGISLHFAQPDYQAGVVPNALATTTTLYSGGQPSSKTYTFTSPHRVTPDVSMVADPNTGMLYGQTYDVSGDPLVDAGCAPLPGNQEYCERRIGGTSLASPLFAGVLALVDQARGSNLGFANPALYGASGGIVDVQAPASPTAVLRNAEVDPTTLSTSLRTINSVPDGPAANAPVIEGADTTLRTTASWDDVTGVGTPDIPNLVTALGG